MADIIARLVLKSGEFDSKIKRAVSGLQQMERECKATGGTLAILEKDQLNYIRSIGKMETVSQSARGKIAELKQGFVEFSVMYKNLSKEAQQGDFGKALAASLDQLKGRIREAESTLAGAESDMKGFGGALVDLGSKMGVPSEMMGLITSGSIGLAAGLGAVATAAGMAANAFAEYNAELAKQDQVTTVTTGLTGDEASKMTDAAASISKVYGADFREVINAANTLMTQFGESGETAMQIIRDGMQGMIEGDGGKLLSMIQQYAPSFRDAGISASQLVAVIQNSEGGIFTDQNMNAIVMGIKNIRLMTNATSEALAQLGINGQEMSRKLNDGSMTIFEALKQVANAIENTNSGSQAAGEVMQQVFGRQGAMAGTKLGEAIATLNTNLEETKTQTGAVGDSLAKLELAQENLNSVMRETFGMNGWEDMSNTLKTSVVEAIAGVLKAWKAVADFSNNLYDWYKWAFGDFVQIITTLVLPGITGITDALETVGVTGKAIFDTIKNAAIGAIGPLGSLIAMLMQLSSTDFNVASNIVKNISSAANAVSDTRNRVKNLMPWNHNKTSNNTTNVPPPPKVGGGRGGGRHTGGRTTSTHTGSNTPKVEMTEEQKLQKQINELVQQGLGMDEQSRAVQRGKIAALQEQLKTIKEIKDELLGIDNMPAKGKIDEVVVKASPEAQMRGKQKAFGEDNLSEKSLSTYISGVKGILSSTDIGSEVYESIKAQLADATGMQEVLQAAMDAGISGVQLDGIGTKMKEALLDGDIPEDMFNDVLKQINKLREEADKDPIRINFETGNLEEVKKDSKGVEKATIAAASAVNQVAGALENVEDPGVKAAAIVAEAIANIALGFAQASAQANTAGTGWGWIAWLAAGAAAMATTISTIHSLTGFAGGGVVEGNSYSGDNQLVRVNAGETILTRAQSGVIADALEGSAMSNLKLETYVSGKRLRIVMNNDSMARGQGKLVSSNTLKG